MRRNCEQPDRDVPALKCGYPLPCPYHTVILSEPDFPAQLEKVIDSMRAVDAVKRLIGDGEDK